MTVRGKNGDVYSASASGSLVNQGTIAADTAGGTLGVGGKFTNAGILEARNGGRLGIATSLAVDGSAVLNVSPTSSATFDGSLTTSLTDLTRFRPQGAFTFSGGTAAAPRLLEVPSKDLGKSLAGFTSNFAFGAITLANNSYMKLVDQFDNVPGGTPEAVYVNSVVVGANSTLDLNGLHVYARAVQVNGTVINGSLFADQIPDSGPLALGVPTPGTISPAGQLDE